MAELLQRALRANPMQRTRIRMLRTELARAFVPLANAQWPLTVGDADSSGARPVPREDALPWLTRAMRSA